MALREYIIDSKHNCNSWIKIKTDDGENKREENKDCCQQFQKPKCLQGKKLRFKKSTVEFHRQETGHQITRVEMMTK